MLILAATPIGNLGDATPRLIDALRSAELIVSEDTRVTKSLLSALGVTTSARFVAANEHSERGVVEEVLEAARDKSVVVVSDAGMPAISDPGYVLVREARDQGIPVSVIPGPSAGISALAVSGLPTDRFVHEGFIPKKGKENYFASLTKELRTMVFFESPHRLGATLQEMAGAWGIDRPACVVRELTKMFEEIAWGTLGELADKFSGQVKGEIVIVVGGARSAGEVDIERAVEMVHTEVARGMTLSAAAAHVAKQTGIAKRTLYQASLEANA